MKDAVAIVVGTVLGLVIVTLGYVGWQAHERNSLCATMFATSVLAQAEGRPFRELNIGSRFAVSGVQGILPLQGCCEVAEVPGNPFLKEVRVRVEWTELGLTRRADYSTIVVDQDA
ncbi:hypothetical protein DYH09_29805 [bacterium CPR1]|nr:hypothetical protein [bacterium CPR1]